jgi:hypothetical protein
MRDPFKMSKFRAVSESFVTRYLPERFRWRYAHSLFRREKFSITRRIDFSKWGQIWLHKEGLVAPCALVLFLSSVKSRNQRFPSSLKGKPSR